jgi:hypothetical protein
VTVTLNFPASPNLGIAEVVGSNPPRSISFIQVNYGIELNSVLTIVGQIQQQKQKRKRKKEND